MTDIDQLSAGNRASLMARLHRLTQDNKSSTLASPGQAVDATTPGNLSPEEKVHRFLAAAKKHQTSVTEPESPQQLPAAIREQLDREQPGNSAATLRLYCGDNATLRHLPWKDQAIELSDDAFIDDNQLSIATAVCGIVETGTVVLTSGAENPTANNFLAGHQILVLEKESLFDNSDQAWEFIKQHCTPLPRAINFISGPSSSGDVGLKIEYGAHGPGKLWVFLV